jgi:hypothetical protein
VQDLDYRLAVDEASMKVRSQEAITPRILDVHVFLQFSFLTSPIPNDTHPFFLTHRARQDLLQTI